MKSRIFNQILSSKRDWHTDDNWKHEICPITQEPISSINPNQVILFIDGFLYDKKSLFQWLETHPRSPMTQIPITSYLQNAGINQHAPLWYNRFMNGVVHTCGLIGLLVTIKLFIIYLAQAELNAKIAPLAHSCHPQHLPPDQTCSYEQTTHLTQMMAQYYFYDIEWNKCKELIYLICSLGLMAYGLSSPTAEENAHAQLRSLFISLSEMRAELEKINASQNSPRP